MFNNIMRDHKTFSNDPLIMISEFGTNERYVTDV